MKPIHIIIINMHQTIIHTQDDSIDYINGTVKTFSDTNSLLVASFGALLSTVTVPYNKTTYIQEALCRFAAQFHSYEELESRRSINHPSCRQVWWILTFVSIVIFIWRNLFSSSGLVHLSAMKMKIYNCSSSCWIYKIAHEKKSRTIL